MYVIFGLCVVRNSEYIMVINEYLKYIQLMIIYGNDIENMQLFNCFNHVEDEHLCVNFDLPYSSTSLC